MRYKNNAIDRLAQLDAVANRIMFQVNRGGTQDQIAETVENLKEQIENLREMISVEPDDFEQQFAPRR
jgi:hypothetical protein